MFDRIFALFLRQIYLIRRSPPRLVTYNFWPTIFMLVWGYFNKFIYNQMPNSGFVLSSLLGANLLMCVMERSNINVMMGFLEDVWSRNMGNILIRQWQERARAWVVTIREDAGLRRALSTRPL